MPRARRPSARRRIRGGAKPSVSVPACTPSSRGSARRPDSSSAVSSRSSSSGWRSVVPSTVPGGAARRAATPLPGTGARARWPTSLFLRRGCRVVSASGSRTRGGRRCWPWSAPWCSARFAARFGDDVVARRLRRVRPVAGGHQRGGLRAPDHPQPARLLHPGPRRAAVRGGLGRRRPVGVAGARRHRRGGRLRGFFAVHLAVPRGMGFGDVRLAGVVGLRHGLAGAGPHLRGVLRRLRARCAWSGSGPWRSSGGGRKTRIPFGPFLAAGAVVTVLWGSPVAHALFHHTV